MVRVLLDVDGVLADFCSPVLEWLGFAGEHHRIVEHDILKCFDLEHLQTELNDFCGRGGFCEGLVVHDGAVEFVERLRKNFEVVVVTSPYVEIRGWEQDRRAWLKRHFGFEKRDVVFASRKSLVSGDFLVDDYPKNFEEFRGEKILIDRPWNRSYGEHEGAVRCFDFEMVCDNVERLSGFT